MCAIIYMHLVYSSFANAAYIYMHIIHMLMLLYSFETCLIYNYIQIKINSIFISNQFTTFPKNLKCNHMHDMTAGIIAI